MKSRTKSYLIKKKNIKTWVRISKNIDNMAKSISKMYMVDTDGNYWGNLIDDNGVPYSRVVVS